LGTGAAIAEEAAVMMMILESFMMGKFEQSLRNLLRKPCEIHKIL